MKITDEMDKAARAEYARIYGVYTAGGGMRRVLEVALAAIPLDEVTVGHCAVFIETCDGPEEWTDLQKSTLKWAAGYLRHCLTGTSVPRPMPTRDDIARAICCPDGCVREPRGQCYCEQSEDKATAVLALFGKAAP